MLQLLGHGANGQVNLHRQRQPVEAAEIRHVHKQREGPGLNVTGCAAARRRHHDAQGAIHLVVRGGHALQQPDLCPHHAGEVRHNGLQALVQTGRQPQLRPAPALPAVVGAGVGLRVQRGLGNPAGNGQHLRGRADGEPDGREMRHETSGRWRARMIPRPTPCDWGSLHRIC